MRLDWSVIGNMSVYLTYFSLSEFAKEHIYVLTYHTVSQCFCNVYGNVTAGSQWAELFFYAVLGQTCH